MNPMAQGIPNVVESTPQGERHYDIYSRLLKDRVIYLAGDVNNVIANAIVGQFLFLNNADPTKPIEFFINSPGGSVSDGLAIYDVMQWITAPVHTTALGMAASMGSFLLMAGEHGERQAMPNTRIMIHQPLIGGGGIKGQETDIRIQAEEMTKTKARLIQIYADHTGMPFKDLEAMMERDRYLDPQQAIELGLIDKISPGKKKIRTRAA